MQVAYTTCAYIAGIVLDILVIRALLRGDYKRFPFLFIYVLVDFLTSVVEIRPVMTLLGSATSEAQDFWDTVYWWNERFIQIVIFVIVISLVYRSTSRLGPRPALLASVVLAIAIFAAVTFAVHFRPDIPTRRWMVDWTRDLNFGAAVLDLALWAILVSSREKDYRILMIAGGLGIQFTGGAMGQALRGIWRQSFREVWPLGGLVIGDLMYLSTLACLYIWWQAFRQPHKPVRTPRMQAIDTPLPDTTPK